MWPRVKKAIEFAWVPGGWDANRDGVMEGVQHNTYDVEFYGPNPHVRHLLSGRVACGRGDGAARRRHYLRGRVSAAVRAGRPLDRCESVQWRILHPAECAAFAKDEIAPHLRSDMGSDDTEQPRVSGRARDVWWINWWASTWRTSPDWGSWFRAEHIRHDVAIDLRYNYKRTLASHDTVQRTFALNDEAAIVICDYGKAKRPQIPFPYYAEVMTGL